MDVNGKATLAPIQCADWHERQAAEEASFDAIPIAKRWAIQIADGYANYYIRKQKPLTLSLIPIFDAYQAHPATIRGLRLSDVKQWQAGEQRWIDLRELLAKDQEAKNLAAK